MKSVSITTHNLFRCFSCRIDGRKGRPAPLPPRERRLLPHLVLFLLVQQQRLVKPDARLGCEARPSPTALAIFWLHPCDTATSDLRLRLLRGHQLRQRPGQRGLGPLGPGDPDQPGRPGVPRRHLGGGRVLPGGAAGGGEVVQPLRLAGGVLPHLCAALAQEVFSSLQLTVNKMRCVTCDVYRCTFSPLVGSCQKLRRASRARSRSESLRTKAQSEYTCQTCSSGLKDLSSSSSRRRNCVTVLWLSSWPRSVVDLLQHLTGIPIPGIARSQTISSDLPQRTKQLIQQHSTMLAFLR